MIKLRDKIIIASPMYKSFIDKKEFFLYYHIYIIFFISDNIFINKVDNRNKKK